MEKKIQSKFKTCLEVWKELKDKALSHQLTSEQAVEADNLIAQHNENYREISCLLYNDDTFKEYARRMKKEVYPLVDKIKAFWDKYGYSDFLVHRNGKVGLKSIDGGIVVPPEYDDISFTYDYLEFFYVQYIVVKKEGKWGLINVNGDILIPFEYDFVFRKPKCGNCYIVVKNGKQGMFCISSTKEKKKVAMIKIPCQMDGICMTDWDLTLFCKDGKWGWWWYDDSSFYHNYNKPEFDEILIPLENVGEDDEDVVFEARLGEEYHIILYWTSK